MRPLATHASPGAGWRSHDAQNKSDDNPCVSGRGVAVPPDRRTMRRRERSDRGIASSEDRRNRRSAHPHSHPNHHPNPQHHPQLHPWNLPVCSKFWRRSRVIFFHFHFHGIGHERFLAFGTRNRCKQLFKHAFRVRCALNSVAVPPMVQNLLYHRIFSLPEFVRSSAMTNSGPGHALRGSHGAYGFEIGRYQIPHEYSGQ